MKMKLTQLPMILSSLFGLSLIASSSFADQPTNYKLLDDEGWSFSANIDSLHLKPESAYREWLGDTAYTFGIAAEDYNSQTHLVYGVGLNFISYDDQAGFSQLTNRGTKDSSASAIAVFGEIGTRYWFNGIHDNFVSFHAGYSGITASNRGIDYCSNCYTESIHMDGGGYGTIRFGHRFNSFDLSVHYQKFFSGDFDNAFGIKIATNF